MKKRLFSILLALSMMLTLSLVACSENTPKVNLSETVVGEWTGTYIWQGVTISNGNDSTTLHTGDTVKFTMYVFKGGAMEIIRENENGYELTSTGTWEISDGVLVITYGDIVTSWEINTDTTPNTLSKNGSSDVFPKTLTKEN